MVPEDLARAKVDSPRRWVGAANRGALDLRPERQHGLHAQEEPARSQRPDRLRHRLSLRRDRRQESDRFRRFDYDQLVGRDKTNPDILWLKDDSLEDVDSLPEPDVIAAEIVENLREALAAFTEVEEEFVTESG